MWFELFTLAERYGWKPSGTLEPRDYKGEVAWTGDYKLPLGQLVSADDAHALSEALRFARRATKALISKDRGRGIDEFVKFCMRGEFECCLPRSWKGK